MPPKKRPLAEADPNAPTPKKGKTSKKSTQAEEGSHKSNQISGKDDQKTQSDKENEALKDPPPFEYYCIPRPFSDLENENRLRDEESSRNEDQLIDEYNEHLEKLGRRVDKTAADLPNHKWICMWKCFEIFSDWSRLTTYTNPNNFDMHIYKHFHGYGVQELLENLFVAFNKEFKKKTRDENNIKQMWATVTGLIYWMLQDNVTGVWQSQDDGDRVDDAFNLIGRAFLSCLNELDRANLLKTESDIKDLGLVMAIYLEWSRSMENYCIEEEEDLKWRKQVAAYARKANIQLENTGCYGITDALQELAAEYGALDSLEGPTKADRWSWKQNFKEYSDRHSPVETGSIGGHFYNILRMSRKERAEYALDEKDPLKDFSQKDLREGKIMLA